MQKLTLSLALAIAAFGAGCTNLERSRDLGNPDVSGKTLAEQVCSNCHGVDGNSVSPQFPKLAGQQKEYLESQLKKFRGHGRLDPPGREFMWGLSHTLTDAQIAGIAEYFSQQVPKPGGAVDPAEFEAGKRIFENGIPGKEAPPCSVCHGPKAQGMQNFPRLAGQHQEYIVNQLHVFQNNEGRPGTPMNQVSHLLTPKDMQAVAAYLQALPD